MDHLDYPKSMAGARDQFTKFTNANSMASAPSVVLTPQPRPQVYWIPPPNDTSRVNFDEAIFKDANQVRIGVIIRDNRGLVIESMSQKVTLPNSVDDIEAMQSLLNPLWI